MSRALQSLESRGRQLLDIAGASRGRFDAMRSFDIGALGVQVEPLRIADRAFAMRDRAVLALMPASRLRSFAGPPGKRIRSMNNASN